MTRILRLLTAFPLALTLELAPFLPEAGEAQDKAYARGTSALDEKKWTAAADAFVEAAKDGGGKTDGALYWRAYALAKAGRRSDAATALRDLETRFPESRWQKDARALAAEIGVPQRRDEASDPAESEDLRLIALESLARQDPDRALPIVDKVLAGPSSSEMKERALFVLAQSSSPAARERLVAIARGSKDQELQEEAVRYLAIHGGASARQTLQEIYTTASREVKEEILRGFMAAGDRDRVVAAAKTEGDKELRIEAIRLLGPMGAVADLDALYKSTADRDVKEAVLDAWHVAGATDRLLEAARGEKDGELRAEAVRRLGLFGKERTGATLLAFATSDANEDVRESAVDALFVQGNAPALIQIAKTSKDRELRKAAVEKLSHIRSKESQDYLLELLK